MLTGNEATTWYDFDQQWNQIKPPAEDMRMKLVRLEDMRQNLPAWEQKAIDGSQALVFDIASETHKLRGELNRYDNDFSNPPTPISRSTARMLARDAGRLIRTVEPPATGPMNSASPASPMKG
jgi:hypothetical protein